MARFEEWIVRTNRPSLKPVAKVVLLVLSLHGHSDTVEVTDIGEDIRKLIGAHAVGKEVIHVNDERVLERDLVGA